MCARRYRERSRLHGQGAGRDGSGRTAQRAGRARQPDRTGAPRKARPALGDKSVTAGKARTGAPPSPSGARRHRGARDPAMPGHREPGPHSGQERQEWPRSSVGPSAWAGTEPESSAGRNW
ncbi:hypothetical protein GCM10010518_28130 [Kitasatospora cinereorecta]